MTNTAAALREVASERSALQDAISRAPAVLRQGTRGARPRAPHRCATPNPALRDLRPMAPQLATLLRRIEPAVRRAVPTIAGVQALVPGRRAGRSGSSRPSSAWPRRRCARWPRRCRRSRPILAGLRPYMPDAISGFFNGVGGASGGTYDANGHYLKSELTVQGGGGSLSGLLSLLGGVTGSLGPVQRRAHAACWRRAPAAARRRPPTAARRGPRRTCCRAPATSATRPTIRNETAGRDHPRARSGRRRRRRWPPAPPRRAARAAAST